MKSSKKSIRKSMTRSGIRQPPVVVKDINIRFDEFS